MATTELTVCYHVMHPKTRQPSFTAMAHCGFIPRINDEMVKWVQRLEVYLPTEYVLVCDEEK